MTQGNLFLDSMDRNKVAAINEVKENKAYLHRIINDLGKVFYLNGKHEPNKDSYLYWMKVNNWGNYYKPLVFTADKDGIKFTAHGVWAKTVNKFKDKYPESKMDHDNFQGTIIIRINRGDDNTEKFRNIVTIMESKGYHKIF